MKLNPDDPRLTAYALGELPADEREAFELELLRSPEARAAVEEIRQAAALLETQLATEESPGLSFAQQRKIENQLRSNREKPRSLGWRILFYGGLSAATICLVAAFLLPSLAKTKSKTIRITAQTEPQLVSNSSQISALLPMNPSTPVEAGKNIESMKAADQAIEFHGSPVSDKSSAAANVALNFESGQVAQPATPPPSTLYSLNGAGSVQPQSGAPVESAAQPEVTLTGITPPVDKKHLLASSYSRATPTSPNVEVRTRFVETSDAKGEPASDGYSVGVVGYVDQTAREVPAFGDEPQVGRYFRSANNRTETASYPHLVENSFQSARNAPLSTFSIDVDTASYANVRRFLTEGRMPPRDAVRIEELVNYFSYNYPQPRGDAPFSANIEVAGCPWNADHRLVRIGLQGREMARDKRPPSNFVFLIDVSGSMQPRERLPLIKQALRQLVKKMNEQDRVAIVVYASEAGLKLESTSCAEKEKILRAIDELGAGGSTNGGDGIRQAYRVAEENFIKDGVNRVLLCTDGDFNVGMTDQNELVRMIQQKAKSGVFLTTLGVGTDNYKDALMQKLADKGNGNYHYLDTLEEAQKVLIDQMNGTLVTIAKDVKIQVEFNPAQVGAYRLIGYEKRMLRKEDFNNDAKDAGEIGAGHTVTALYEIVPPGGEIQNAVDDLKYQQPVEEKPERYVTTGSRELLTLKLRYKQPDSDRSRLLEFPITDGGKRFSSASKDFQFAAAVASFGMLLRDSEFKGRSSFGAVLEWAESAKGADAEGYRAEFLNLVRKARTLQWRE